MFSHSKSFSAAAADGCLVYVKAVGVGGPAVNVGKAKTMAECIKIAVQKQPKTNGVTLSGTDCEARTGLLYVQDSGDCKHTCFINQKITGWIFEFRVQHFESFHQGWLKFMNNFRQFHCGYHEKPS